MGISGSKNNNQVEDESKKNIQNIGAEAEPIPNENKQEIIKEVDFGSSPIAKDEYDELYSYESALCKIKFVKIEDGKAKTASGTGFFCEINDINIPFRQALFTNNHVLDENSININKQIEFEYCGEQKKIEITNRRKFTNEKLDYTCIEINDLDKINKFFNIDKTIFSDKNSLINKDLFILQYPHGTLSIDKGKILDINNNTIEHKIPTQFGSSGSPLIKRYSNNLVVGIHCGAKIKNETKEIECNLATPFDAIIEDMIYQLIQNKNKAKEYRNTINLIYNKKSENNYSNRIFGEDFVKNNEKNISLIINGERSELAKEYRLKIGKNNIQMIIKNELINLHSMFEYAESLENIEELQYLNTEKVNNFSSVFSNCLSLSDIKALENWNVSNGNNFSCMFSYCSLLSDIKALENWDVSNGNNFSHMFSQCSSLSDIKALQKWDVSNGNNFLGIFSYCSSLSDIKALENWNVSNGNNFSWMFSYCKSLSDVKPLENWNVLNGNTFYSMFSGCSSLSDIKALENWKVSNGNNFSYMFNECSSLSDIKPLQNWNVSNGNNFKGMFYYCSSLSDVKPLQKWKVSSKKYFSKMFWKFPH